MTSDRIGLQLVRLIRLMERKRVSKVGDDGVERAADVPPARLVIDGPHRSNALAEAAHSDPSTVSRQVAALVRIGYVERRPDPADGRACLLAATDEGHRCSRRTETSATARSAGSPATGTRPTASGSSS